MKRTKEKHSFGLPDIGIPSEVLFHPELTHTEKILFGFLRNLSQSEKGCWASNKWLSGLIGVKGQTISNSIAKLKECEYILVEYEQLSDGRQERHIFINPEYPQIYRKLVIEAYKNLNSPLLENLFPSIKKIIHPYKKTYSKIVKEKVSKKENKKKKIFDLEKKIMEKLPPEYTQDESFHEALSEYITHRMQLNSKGLTHQAIAGFTNKLKKYPIEIATRALQRSVENGWTGVFPESEKEKAPSGVGSNRSGGDYEEYGKHAKKLGEEENE